MAVLLAQLGLRCTFATAFGSDERSAMYREYLSDIGVDLGFAIETEWDLPRCIFLPGNRYMFADGRTGLEDLCQLDVCSAASMSGVTVAVEVPISRLGLEPSACYLSPQLLVERPGLAAIAHHDWRAVFLSRTEMRGLEEEGGPSLQEMSLRHPTTRWIVTDEARPTRVFQAGTVRIHEVPRTECTSSVGGGDAFAAAYCAAELRGWDEEGCCQFGHTLAGAVVRQIGCQLPSADVRAICTEHRFS